MKNYIYVVVIVGEDHNAKTAVIAGDKELKGLSLSKVLAMGYTPLRESAMSGGAVAHSLILLERDGNGAAPAERPAAAERPSAEKAASPLPMPTISAALTGGAAPAPKAAVKAAVVTEPKKATVAAKAAPVAAPAEKAAAPAAAPAAAAAEGGDKKKVSDSDISFDFLNDVDE
jgi:hypothetical protein